jgi:hypothetical protein
VTPLERRCRWLLLAYPTWYRRERAGEMLGTLLEASAPGRRWPSFRDARALVAGGLRVRGWVWLLSMLWVVAGAAITGYIFFVTTQPPSWADVSLGIPLWSTDPEAFRIAVVLALAAWVVLPIPVPIAGFVRLRGWRQRNWLRTAAWAGAWIAGLALMYLANVWGEDPGYSPAIGSPAVVSWRELGIVAAWLVLGAVMTSILAAQHRGRNAPETSSRSSRQAS